MVFSTSPVKRGNTHSHQAPPFKILQIGRRKILAELPGGFSGGSLVRNFSPPSLSTPFCGCQLTSQIPDLIATHFLAEFLSRGLPVVRFGWFLRFCFRVF